LSALTVGSAEESAAVVNSILDAEKSPARDHALLNAAAALHVAGLASDLRNGLTMAAHAVDSGSARDTLRRWRALAPIPPKAHTA
jgi:anthranilate phosphoribosyltransferase